RHPPGPRPRAAPPRHPNPPRRRRPRHQEGARSFLDAVAGGGLDCGYLRAKSSAIIDGDYTPNFALTTAAKDARLIVEAGEANGVRLDVAEAGANRFARAEAQGHGEADMAATYFASFEDHRA
ncbi:NAD-binding protein, partial [Streptomyces niveus]|uniref:NAD-binding protein n=1 Tax=Streptomyces niveus TaxID=193462 RepID=UPI00341600E0